MQRLRVCGIKTKFSSRIAIDVVLINTANLRLSRLLALNLNRSDGVVNRASASKAVDAGSIPVSGQTEDFRRLAFTAFLLGVQH